MNNLSRDFKGIWIPREIWCDRSLNYFEKCLFSEINSLDGKDGCFASNEYFCNFFQEKERKIQDALAHLKALGYIYQESFDGRTRVLRSNLYPSNDKSLFSTSAPQEDGIKSLFSTSGVLDLAPLATGSIHHIEESKVERKEQQQQPSVAAAAPAAAAVVSSKKSEEQGEIALISSLLTKLGIAKDDIDWLCTHYDAPTIAHSVAYATHPLTTIKTTLVQTIKWGCLKKPPIPVREQQKQIEKQQITQDIIDKNKEYAKKLQKTVTLSDDVGFKIDETKVTISVYKGKVSVLGFLEHGFCEQLDNLLRKHNARLKKSE